MRLLQTLFACVACLFATSGVANTLPDVKLAALKFGTVKWELETIKRLELDKKNGFNLEVVDVAGKQASSLAIQNDAVDVIVTDWIWVANQRSEGKDYQFTPYSKAVGSLMVGPKSSVSSLKDLEGKRIGIAGGPVDKSWIVIQAIAKKRYGIDLASQNELVFGAPPLLFKQAMSGEVDAVINFWHFLAKLEAKGSNELSMFRTLQPSSVCLPKPLFSATFSRKLGPRRIRNLPRDCNRPLVRLRQF